MIELGVLALRLALAVAVYAVPRVNELADEITGAGWLCSLTVIE